METKIVKLGINGEGIGYYQKKPVFLPGALPEETVEFRIVNKQPRYLEGKVERIVKKSPYRIRPVCPHQGRCDGCPLMVLNESEQRKLKQENFIQTLQKYANVSERVMEPMIENPKPLAYRNQCKLPVVMEKGKLVNALYMQNSNYTVPIKTCYVQETGLESMRQAILDVLNAYHILV